MNWLKGIPYIVLIGGSVLMALLPFSAESHLLEKLGMLIQGDLSKPIDIFDLFLHASPMFLLVTKYILEQKSKN
ncbi:MAG: hypothetical protein R8M11_05875 [Gallionella sp.]